MTELSYFVAYLFAKADSKAVDDCLWRGSLRHTEVTRYCLIQPGSAAGSTKLANASAEALVGALDNREDKQSLSVPSHPALPETGCCCTYKGSQIRLLFRCPEGEFLLDRPVIEGTADVRPAGVLCAVERHSKFTNGVATAGATRARAAATTSNSTISYRVVSH